MPIRMPKVLYDVVTLKGGLDQVTPTLSLKPGVARDAVNFECAPTGGYTRIAGYERFDGLAKPSDATYVTVQVAAFTNVPSVGQTLTGQTTGTTGVIVAVVESELYMVLTKIAVSSYNGTEVLKVGATTIGTQVAFTGTVTSLQSAQYTNLAADVYRALIAAVPGSGPIRGIFGLTVGGVDKVYAFRNNAGATSLDLWVASASSWTQVAYKREVAFTAGGAAEPADGATLTQGAVTATVRRVMASSGTWTGTAAGKFIVDTVAGGAGVFAAGAATLTGGAAVTLSGADTAIAVLPSGYVETAIGNYTGSVATVRVYGVDGVNRAFEFDGTTYAPIDSGAATDTPAHLAVHKNALVLALSSSLVLSGPGVPYRFLTVDGGVEIATGGAITGTISKAGSEVAGALVAYTLTDTYVLYGSGLSDWNLVHFEEGTGAVAHTIQNMTQTYSLGSQGVTSLSAAQEYGNFSQAALTASIRPFILAERSKAVASSLSRDKNQYRVFFSDGTGLYITVVNRRLLGSMPVSFPDIPTATWAGTASNGNEFSYFGDADGMVYQLDVGPNFDGDPIVAYFTLNWNPMGSPRALNRYRKASVEMQGSFYAAINYGYQLGYGTAEINQPNPVAYASGFQAAPNWDAFTWDNFSWDGRTLFPTEVNVTGTAENMQVTISSETDYIMPYTVNSIINHYTPRRGLR